MGNHQNAPFARAMEGRDQIGGQIGDFRRLAPHLTAQSRQLGRQQGQHLVAAEVVGAVGEALRNVELHAGPGAAAWVLVEDVADEVIVTVRDDGVGIAPGRLDEAAAEGRMGVAKSIRGRVAEFGGRLEFRSAPGEGTEIEIVVARGSGR
jgi:signal transduction histidine kinase